ncbi:MAG: ABC transporter substrate-binding protein [Chloroflexi bacterium]|nr:MAG: ABC transporter substrate-binding protein [Chloroflexota bacterium]
MTVKNRGFRWVLLVSILALVGSIVPAGIVFSQDDVECGTGETASITWVSPRGTLEVMDDYPLWVATEMGYFEELGLDVQLEPGPLGGANVMSLLPEGQADVGYPSPGVLTSSIDADIPIILAFEMVAGQVFDFAVRADSDIQTIADLEGKTISLGSAGWQPIVDPILMEQGIPLDSVTYVEAGNQWGQAVDQGQADVALAWEGLRAQWDSIGLDFRYLIGTEFSNDPSNGYAIRAADLEDPDQVAVLTCFFRGVAMGLEFARVNPQAAAQITYNQFPALQEQMTPELALESMRQLAFLYNQTNAEGHGYGFSDVDNWQSYLDRVAELGQTQRQLSADEVVTNFFVEAANDFDHDAVAEDAMNFELSEEWANLELQGPIEPSVE